MPIMNNLRNPTGTQGTELMYYIQCSFIALIYLNKKSYKLKMYIHYEMLIKHVQV